MEVIIYMNHYTITCEPDDFKVTVCLVAYDQMQFIPLAAGKDQQSKPVLEQLQASLKVV